MHFSATNIWSSLEHSLWFTDILNSLKGNIHPINQFPPPQKIGKVSTYGKNSKNKILCFQKNLPYSLNEIYVYTHTHTWRQLHKNVESNTEQVLVTTPHETPTVRPPASHHENYTGQTSQTRRTLLEKQRWARKWRTTMDPHIWPSKSRTTSPNLHSAAMWGHRM